MNNSVEIFGRELSLHTLEIPSATVKKYVLLSEFFLLMETYRQAVEPMKSSVNIVL